MAVRIRTVEPCGGKKASYISQNSTSSAGNTSNHPSHLSHREAGPQNIRCMVITCSDTRTRDTDISGKTIQELLHQAGHQIADYHVVKDEPEEIRKLIQRAVHDPNTHAVIINGGTGISRRDSTFEAIEGLMEKKLSGFGEIFRYLSYKEIGSAAILSRATAGLVEGTIVFSIPGSTGAVRLAMEQLIIPELPHLVGETTKETGQP